MFCSLLGWVRVIPLNMAGVYKGYIVCYNNQIHHGNNHHSFTNSPG